MVLFICSAAKEFHLFKGQFSMVDCTSLGMLAASTYEDSVMATVVAINLMAILDASMATRNAFL